MEINARPPSNLDAIAHSFFLRAMAEKQRFLGALASSRKTQQDVLRKCLADNADTAFGREHGFARIADAAQFRRAVPIRTYDEMSPWLERAAGGEPAVLTMEAPCIFYRTSGTTGPAKMIPQTFTRYKECSISTLLVTWATVLEHAPHLLQQAESTLPFVGIDPRAASEWTAGGIPYQPISQFFDWVQQMPGSPGTRAPWTQIPSYVNPAERTLYRLRVALESDLRCWLALNPSTFVAAAQVLADQAPDLIEQVRLGQALGQSLGSPNPRRADELQALLRAHGRLLPRHVWPNLQTLVCWISTASALYLPQLHKLFGPQVDVLPFPIVSSEGPIAIPIEAEPAESRLPSAAGHRGLPMMVSSGFFEFLPIEQAPARADSQTLLLHELELGREYELIMTQTSGLYRFAIGDVLRVRSFIHDVPRVEFVGRSGATSFTGEKLTEGQVLRALRAALEAQSLQVSAFTMVPRWGTPPFYMAVLEPSGEWSPAQGVALAAELEAQLGRHNDEYPSKRESGRLGPVTTLVVGPGTFSRVREAAVALGAAAEQVKLRVLQRDESWLRLLEWRS